jgi:hypothetical protein
MVTYISLKEAAKRFPGHPHASTVARWALTGSRGVKLKSTRVGRRLFFTEEAIDKFLTELNKTDSERLEERGC